MQIDELMSQRVYTCDPNDSLQQAARLMWDHDCGCVPVVDAENRIIGMLTDRDIAMAACLQAKALDQIRVETAMAKCVYSCLGSASISAAQELMRRHQLRRLPVTDSLGFLIGVISLNDLAIEAAREHSTRHPQLRLADVAETLAHVSVHRSPKQLAAAE